MCNLCPVASPDVPITNRASGYAIGQLKIYQAVLAHMSPCGCSLREFVLMMNRFSSDGRPCIKVARSKLSRLYFYLVAIATELLS